MWSGHISPGWSMWSESREMPSFSQVFTPCSFSLPECCVNSGRAWSRQAAESRTAAWHSARRGSHMPFPGEREGGRRPCLEGSRGCSENGCLNSCAGAEGKPSLSQAERTGSTLPCYPTNHSKTFPRDSRNTTPSPRLGVKRSTSYTAFRWTL